MKVRIEAWTVIDISENDMRQLQAATSSTLVGAMLSNEIITAELTPADEAAEVAWSPPVEEVEDEETEEERTDREALELQDERAARIEGLVIEHEAGEHAPPVEECPVCEAESRND